MAGISLTGFSIKRLPDIISDLQGAANSIFSDLVPEGDTVDTGPNSALGREIGLISPSIADLWEAAQEIYDSFNINAATGIALDNLVALGGLTRLQPTGSVAPLLLAG